VVINLGLHVVAMLGNIVINLGEEDGHYEYTFCWFGGSLKTLLGQLGSILQKFITISYFGQFFFSCSLNFSHLSLYGIF